MADTTIESFFDWYEIVEKPVITEKKYPRYVTKPGALWGLIKPRTVFDGFDIYKEATMVVADGPKFTHKTHVGDHLFVMGENLPEAHIYVIVSSVPVGDKYHYTCRFDYNLDENKQITEDMYSGSIKAALMSSAFPENSSAPSQNIYPKS